MLEWEFIQIKSFFNFAAACWISSGCGGQRKVEADKRNRRARKTEKGKINIVPLAYGG
jgi:hypothetical protein